VEFGWLDRQLGENANTPTPAVKGLWWNPGWIPIVSSGSGHLICLDMDPNQAGNVGQVILFLHDDGQRPLIAHNLRAWFVRLADDLERGLYKIVEDADGYRHFNGHALMWSSLEAKDLYDDPPPEVALA
jgi:cell wall assembly regulator SMI1